MEGDGRPILWLQLKHRLERHLVASGLPHSIVRPTVFTETHALTLIAEPLRSGRKVQFFGSARTPLNWVSTEDVAAYVVDLLDGDHADGRIHRVGGPDRLSRLDVLAKVERALGVSAKRAHVPAFALRGLRRLAGPIHPGLRYALDLAIAEDSRPDHPAWNPPDLDWTGPTTVDRVLDRWLHARADAA